VQTVASLKKAMGIEIANQVLTFFGVILTI